MKLIQLNIWGGRVTSPLESFIRSESPDILCLQEAIDLPGGRGALFVSVDEIKQILDADFHFMSPAFSFNFMHRKADFGNCIISKFPILEQKTIFTGRDYEADFDWTKHTQNIRNLQRCVIKTPDGEINIFNHHGHHNHVHKNGDEENTRQLAIIADELKKAKGKRILSGDFNLVPDSASLKQINGLLTNLSEQYKFSTTRNELTSETDVCDYIFVSKDIKVKRFEASDRMVSDHKALILEFE